MFVAITFCGEMKLCIERQTIRCCGGVGLQLFDAEAAHPPLVRQLLTAVVADAVCAANTDASGVQQPHELLATAHALPRRVDVRAAAHAAAPASAYHSAQSQLTHLALDLTATIHIKT